MQVENVVGIGKGLIGNEFVGCGMVGKVQGFQIFDLVHTEFVGVDTEMIDAEELGRVAASAGNLGW